MVLLRPDFHCYRPLWILEVGQSPTLWKWAGRLSTLVTDFKIHFWARIKILKMAPLGRAWWVRLRMQSLQSAWPGETSLFPRFLKPLWEWITDQDLSLVSATIRLCMACTKSGSQVEKAVLFTTARCVVEYCTLTSSLLAFSTELVCTCITIWVCWLTFQVFWFSHSFTKPFSIYTCFIAVLWSTCPMLQVIVVPWKAGEDSALLNGTRHVKPVRKDIFCVSKHFSVSSYFRA